MTQQNMAQNMLTRRKQVISTDWLECLTIKTKTVHFHVTQSYMYKIKVILLFNISWERIKIPTWIWDFQHQADKSGMHYKPAKCKPALLQAIAVIIMCEPSSECTKFGGNADLCRLLSTWRSNMTIHQNEGKPKPIPCELNLEVKLPYHSPAARPEAEVLFLSASSSEKI